LRAHRSGSFSAGATLSVHVTGSISADAWLKKIGQSGSLTSHAVLKKQQSATTSAAAVLLRTSPGSFTAASTLRMTSEVKTIYADAILRRAATPGSLTANAVLGHAFRVSAILRGHFSSTFSANAVLGAQAAQPVPRVLRTRITSARVFWTS
jgi:hypothetical protein